MQTTMIVGFVILACVYAQVSQPPYYKEKYPDIYKFVKRARRSRDVTLEKQMGDGKIHTTIGSKDGRAYGEVGYKKDIFNNGNGRLTGGVSTSRVIGPDGGNSYVGGNLNWNNAANNAKANLEVTKQINGRTSTNAGVSKVWDLDKNTRFSAGGTFSHSGRGRPRYGAGINFEHSFG